jgi:hypothetical protein
LGEAPKGKELTGGHEIRQRNLGDVAGGEVDGVDHPRIREAESFGIVVYYEPAGDNVAVLELGHEFEVFLSAYDLVNVLLCT